MHKILILTLLLQCLSFAGDLPLKKELPYNEQIQLLQSIQEEAIIYGSGKQNVYVFIDPWCRYSKKFIAMITENKTMLSKYKYYLYLYGIPRHHSQNAIAAIFRAEDPLETLLDIMLYDDHSIVSPINADVQKKADAITAVAQKLNVDKRPFLIIEK